MEAFHYNQFSLVSDGSGHVQSAELNNALWSYLTALAVDYVDFFHGVSYRLFSSGPAHHHSHQTLKP